MYKLYLIILLTAWGCTTESQVPTTSEATPQVIKYLALGDSYTIGSGIDSIQGWPVQLSEALDSNNYSVDELQVIARLGWRTDNLLAAIEDTPKDSFNLVSLLIGVNNQFQRRPLEYFQTQFDTLLQKAILLSGEPARVFVVSIPDYGVTPFGQSNAEQIGAELDQYNAYMAEQSQLFDIPFIDITELSRELGASEGALATDNLHPSAMQYSQWVELIYPVVDSLLKQ